MGLLSTNKVASLKKESEGCFNIFKQTVENLGSVNAKIAIEINTREEQIAVLQSEQGDLMETQSNNSRLAQKINDFLA